MDERFERFFKDILRHEGGYSNDKDDLGGETKYGISKKSYPHLDIKNLTVEHAKVIYYYDYFVKGKFDEIAKISFQVASKGCDIAINCGIHKSHVILVDAINEFKPEYKISKIDTDYLLFLQKIVLTRRLSSYIDAIIKHQTNYYISLVEKNPKLSKFLNGWLKRAKYRGVEEYG